MHFVTHFIHVSRHFGVYCKKNKQKILRENCFEIVVSEVNKKWFKSPQNYFQKKVQKLIKKKKAMKTFKIFGGFWGQNYFFWQISETIFSEQFSQKIFFCFLLQTPKRLETCVKCITKCVTPKIYPMKVRILQIIFFKVTYVQFKPFFHKSETRLPKQFFLILFFVFYSKLQDV